MRAVPLFTSMGSLSVYVDFSFDKDRCSSISLGSAESTWNVNEFTVEIFTSVGIPGTGAKYNAGTFSVINVNNVSLTGTNATYNAGTFSAITNMAVSLTGAEARFNEDIRVWLLTTPPTRTFIWTLDSNN